MACVLEFRRSPFHYRPPAAEPGRTAEIVLFPGVRYERQSEDEPESQKPRLRRRRRDRLDLDD